MSIKHILDHAEIAFFAELQKFIHRKKIPLLRNVSKICAVDAAYHGDRVVAVASVFDRGRLAERSSYTGRCSLPYVSGLFYLREGPFVVEAVRRLKVRPQLLCFDAHGAAHPRSAGLATVCGIVLGIPSIGIAKSLLVGSVAPGQEGLGRIVYEGKTVGFGVKTNGAVRYWSSGYSVSLGELKLVIRRHAPVCIRAMSESDREAKKQIRSAQGSLLLRRKDLEQSGSKNSPD
jgi:deoxyribonuclease V